jgi:hypothetical protein
LSIKRANKVTVQKKQEQLERGKLNAAQFGITPQHDVFLKLSEIFNCASWEIRPEPAGFTAEATTCKLCGLSKKLGTQQPCGLYGLDPMEGMVKGLDVNSEFIVQETLWDGNMCKVTVRNL